MGFRDRLRTPSIVVTIPAYKAASTITRTLASIDASLAYCIDQKHFPVNATIAVVDDVCPEDTGSVAAAFPAKHATIKVIRNAENRGPAFARNEGVRRTTAPYLFFLDADDEFLTPHIHTLLTALMEDDTLGYAYTSVDLGVPMHPDWQTSVDASVPWNFCVRRLWHDMIMGFAEEEDDFRIYRTEDTLYRMSLRELVNGRYIREVTVRQHFMPGNSLDRQKKKFAMSKADWAALPDAEKDEDGFVITPAMEKVVVKRLDHVQKLKSGA